MPKPKKPWRTVMHGPDKAGRFTREQVREAWRVARMKIEAREKELESMRVAENVPESPNGATPGLDGVA